MCSCLHKTKLQVEDVSRETRVERIESGPMAWLLVTGFLSKRWETLCYRVDKRIKEMKEKDSRGQIKC
jgi:hypothetical protein